MSISCAPSVGDGGDSPPKRDHTLREDGGGRI